MNFIGNNFFGLLDNQPSTSTGLTSSTLNSININQMYTISMTTEEKAEAARERSANKTK